jgi:putative FmdB family regulatory protein
MPIYEYRCEKCEKVFEIQHRMSESKTVCEECGGALERLISRTAFQFKGGGWYKDLYSSTKPSGGGDSSGGSGTSSGSSDSGSGSSSSGSSDSGSSSSSGGGSSSSAAAGPAQ